MAMKSTGVSKLTGLFLPLHNKLEPLPSGTKEYERTQSVARGLHKESREWKVACHELQDLRALEGKLREKFEEYDPDDGGDSPTTAALRAVEANQLRNAVAAAAVAQKEMETELEGVQDARWHVCWLSHVTLGATSARPLDFLVNQPSLASASGSNNSRANQRASAKQRQQSIRGGPAAGDDAGLLHELQLSREQTITIAARVQTNATKAHALAQHRARQEAAGQTYSAALEAARDLRDTVRHKMQVFPDLGMDENGDNITEETKKRWAREFTEAAAGIKAGKVAYDAEMAASLEQYSEAESALTSENHCSTGDSAVLEAYTVKRHQGIMEAFGKEGRMGMKEADVQARARLEWYDMSAQDRAVHTSEAVAAAKAAAQLPVVAKEAEQQTINGANKAKSKAGQAFKQKAVRSETKRKDATSANQVIPAKKTATNDLRAKGGTASTAYAAKMKRSAAETTTPNPKPKKKPNKIVETTPGGHAQQAVCWVCEQPAASTSRRCAMDDCEHVVHTTGRRPDSCFPVEALVGTDVTAFFCGVQCASDAVKSVDGGGILCCGCREVIPERERKACKGCARPTHADTLQYPKPLGCECILPAPPPARPPVRPCVAEALIHTPCAGPIVSHDGDRRCNAPCTVPATCSCSVCAA